MLYDAIVIGSGQAGPFLAADLANEGQGVALIEGDKIGGTCVNYGCTPSKTLISSARAAYVARQGAHWGVHTGDVKVDFAAVMARVNRRRGASHNGMDSWMRSIETLDVYDGYGAFVGHNGDLYQVGVNGEVLESPHVFINIGARAFVPPIDGIDTVEYLTNRNIFDLTELPRHLVILGGGYIGVEFAQAFRRLGAEVTVIEMLPRLFIREDEDISALVQELLEREGVRVLTGAKATQVAGDADGVHVTVEGDYNEVVNGSHLLVAVGRRPNSDNLNLEAVGVEINERGFIRVDDHLRTTAPGIWALGDVNGLGAFTHTSYHDYEIVLDNLRGGMRKVSERNMTYAVFIDPPLGRVGMNKTQARQSDRNVLITIKPFKHMGRALERGEPFGLFEVLVDADTQQILGATVFGIGGDEIVHVFNYYMATGATIQPMIEALPVHPTIAEFVPTLLKGLKPLE